MYLATLFTIAQNWKQPNVHQEWNRWEFPGGPVVRTQRFHCRSPGSIAGQGNEIPQATPHSHKNEMD